MPLPQLTVKFVTKHYSAQDSVQWLRMTPNRSGVWGRCRFVPGKDTRTYDWLVVYDDLPRSYADEILACPPGRTILVTNEPASIKSYEPVYTSQFGHVITSQSARDLPHPSRVYHPSTLLWYYGLHGEHLRDYDGIAATLPTKTADFSTVCSSKRQRHTLHRLRYDFTHALRERLPGLQIYGHGVRPMEDKAEALEPYRYHLVFENELAPHHWTEKLVDAFLAGCLPIYYGCPNAEAYFPADSFIRIDAHDVDSAAKIISDAIASKEYERRLPAIIEARRRVLQDYNLFAVLSRLIEPHHCAPTPSTAARGTYGKLLGRRAARNSRPIQAIPFLLKKLFRKLRFR